MRRLLIVLAFVALPGSAFGQGVGVFSKVQFGAPSLTAPTITFSAADPEGSVTACPGSTHHRTSGGTVGYYAKQAGTGCDSSGWIEIGVNVATANALAANGANCSAGQFPLGVDASGASESCTAVVTTATGTSNEIAVSGSTGAVTWSLPSTLDFGGKTVEIPNSNTLPGSCGVGQMYMDTDATSGQRFYLCESSNTWALQGDGGGGGGTPAGNDDDIQIKDGSDFAAYAGDGCSPGDFVTDIASDGSVTCDTPPGVGGGDRLVGITIDGGGSDITTGVKGFVMTPISGTITAATLLSTDASATACAIVIDVWEDTYANYPPTDADSITASAPPTLSGPASKSQDVTLTGWDTTVTAGAIYGFNVDSVTACTRVTLVLTVTP